MAREADIRIRRSAVAGAIPTPANLNLGELALNTYDGKAYMKKTVGGTETVVEIGGGSGQTAVWKEYTYTATSNQTVFSGSDDDGSTLTYLEDYLQVFLNGILLDNGIDYTAITGTTVVLTNGATTGEIIQISSFAKVLGTGDIARATFAGTGSQVAFDMLVDPGTENNINAFIDGVYQEKSGFSVSGTVVTFDEAPPNTAVIEVMIGTRNVSLPELQDLTIGGNLTVEGTTTSTAATTQVNTHTMSATAFRSAKYTIQVTNSTDSTYHITEILMIHDGTTPSITEYGTIYTGAGVEATFDADISGGLVRLRATPSTTDSMVFKVVCHNIAV